MNILYLDACSGISGDMLLGALVDLGADKNELIKQLSLLNISDEFNLVVNKVEKHGFNGTDLQVEIIQKHDHEHSHDKNHEHNKDHEHSHDKNHEHHEHHEHSHDKNHEHHGQHHEHHEHSHDNSHRLGYTKIKEIIQNSGLSKNVKEKATAIFLSIAKAEAQVHATTIEQIHFHEIGAVDSIVDICGACICIEMLDIEEIYCSNVNLGGGKITFSHGTVGVPAPATTILSKGIPVYGDLPQKGELTTPSGMAIVATLAKSFGAMPLSTIFGSGVGFGKRETGDVNALWAIIAKKVDQNEKQMSLQLCKKHNSEKIICINFTIDDMSGEEIAFAAEKIREYGAIEVYISQVFMKKGRPGNVFNVIIKDDEKQQQLQTIADIIFKHTTTLGIRHYKAERKTLQREISQIQTTLGQVQRKTAFFKGKERSTKIEFETLAKIANENDISIFEARTKINLQSKNKK